MLLSEVVRIPHYYENDLVVALLHYQQTRKQRSLHKTVTSFFDLSMVSVPWIVKNVRVGAALGRERV
jgi:hypothetical protein